MNFKSGLSAARAWLCRTRFRCLLVMALLCLVLRENYPFSNFPMYSSFSSRTYYVYLTDAEDQPLKTREFGLSSSGLKKIFDRYRRGELEQVTREGNERVAIAEQAAAQSLLHYLDGLAAGRRQVSKLLAGLRVKHVLVRQDAHDVILETRTLASHP
jgi:hypothetical protein